MAKFLLATTALFGVATGSAALAQPVGQAAAILTALHHDLARGDHDNARLRAADLDELGDPELAQHAQDVRTALDEASRREKAMLERPLEFAEVSRHPVRADTVSAKRLAKDAQEALANRRYELAATLLEDPLWALAPPGRQQQRDRLATRLNDRAGPLRTSGRLEFGAGARSNPALVPDLEDFDLADQAIETTLTYSQGEGSLSLRLTQDDLHWRTGVRVSSFNYADTPHLDRGRLQIESGPVGHIPSIGLTLGFHAVYGRDTLGGADLGTETGVGLAATYWAWQDRTLSLSVQQTERDDDRSGHSGTRRDVRLSLRWPLRNLGSVWLTGRYLDAEADDTARAFTLGELGLRARVDLIERPKWSLSILPDVRVRQTAFASGGFTDLIRAGLETRVDLGESWAALLGVSGSWQWRRGPERLERSVEDTSITVGVERRL